MYILKSVNRIIKSVNLNWIIVMMVFVFVLCLMFNAYYYTVETMVSELSDTQNIVMVIARYKEDLAWLKNEPYNQFKHIIYNKGKNKDFYTNKNTLEIVDIPNVGKCDHTYIYDIIRRYDTLSDITLFLPGSMDIDFKDENAKRIIKALKRNQNSAMVIAHYDEPIADAMADFEMDVWETSSDANKDKKVDAETERSKYRPFAKWYKHHFGELKIYDTSYYGVMAVSKSHICNRAKSFYENLITELDTSPNPEVGHFFERAWVAIFHPMDGLISA